MHVRSYITARSRNHCCHGNPTVRSLLLLLPWMSLSTNENATMALLSSCKIFRTAPNNNNCYVLLVVSIIALVCRQASSIVSPLCYDICDLPGCTTYFHIITQPARFFKKKYVIEHKICYRT